MFDRTVMQVLWRALTREIACQCMNPLYFNDTLDHHHFIMTGCLPTPAGYGKIVLGYLSKEKTQAAMNSLIEMRSHGHAPGIAVYSRLIRAWLRSNRLDMAVRVVRIMATDSGRRCVTSSDQSVFEDLIVACARHKGSIDADYVLDFLRSEG